MYLEIKNLSVDLGEFHLQNINLSLKEGEYFVLIGPTGSGKSVLLETIIGFYTATEGDIKLNNRIINNIPPENRSIGIVYQDNTLFPNMNTYDNIAYGAKKKFTDDEIKEKITEIAETMHIDHILHRNIDSLSGGEAQRVALARTLITEPKIILMDEPFSALDITTQTKLTSLIKKIRDDYKTSFLHVTHNFNDVWNSADKVGVMKDGKIHQIGSTDEIFSRPENDFVADFVGVQNIFEGKIIKINSGVIEVKIDDNLIIKSSDISCLKKIDKKNENSLINEEVLITIRPESMIFSNENIESSAKNQLKGKIVDFIESGPTILVNVKINSCIFKGLLTKNSAELLNLQKNKDIYLSFKSLNVNIISK